MIIYIMAMWAISAPMGYLAGDVFATTVGMRLGAENGYFKWLGAAVPPAGAFMALMAIVNAEGKQ